MHLIRRFALIAAPVVFLAHVAGAQQYPVMDMIANKVIQKYQQATCQQLWQRKGKAPTQREKDAIQLLRNDPQMRAAFIDKVAAPIANKMFDCGLIP